MQDPGIDTLKICCPLCGQQPVSLFSTVRDRDKPSQSWQVWQCQTCTYGWTFPEIDPSKLAAYYPSSYLGNTRRMLEAFAAGTLQRHRSWRRETEKVELVERYCSGGKILDIGASNGSFLLALNKARWQRSGVEFIGDVVNLVRDFHPDLDLRQGDIFSSSLEPHSFDVITFWHVFEHLYEPHRVIARVRELLRPSGFVFISVPNFASLQSHLFRSHWYAFDVPRHLHHFSPSSLEYLFEKGGLETRGHCFFSRMNNFHQLKYSLISYSEGQFSSRIPYYLLKPGLFAFQFYERFTTRFGSLTTVGQLQPQ